MRDEIVAAAFERFLAEQAIIKERRPSEYGGYIYHVQDYLPTRDGKPIHVRAIIAEPALQTDDPRVGEEYGRHVMREIERMRAADKEMRERKRGAVWVI